MRYTYATDLVVDVDEVPCSSELAKLRWCKLDGLDGLDWLLRLPGTSTKRASQCN